MLSTLSCSPAGAHQNDYVATALPASDYLLNIPAPFYQSSLAVLASIAIRIRYADYYPATQVCCNIEGIF
jgi:hypothetical protein